MQRDQSYFLYALPQEADDFPAGRDEKTEVRIWPRVSNCTSPGNPKAGKSVSFRRRLRRVCLRGRIPGAFRPGHIVDGKGKIIGCHQGFLNYTIGQRKGMGIAAPRPLAMSLRWTQPSPIVAGPDERLFSNRVSPSPARPAGLRSRGSTDRGRRISKIRSRHEGEPATTFGPRKSVIVEAPDRRGTITPRQAAVFAGGRRFGRRDHFPGPQ